jgi:hypothetical protein
LNRKEKILLRERLCMLLGKIDDSGINQARSARTSLFSVA